MKTNVSDCLHVIPEQLTHSTKSVQNHASMQVNCLEFWVQKIWKNEFFISLYFAQCRYHWTTKNDITPLNQIHKTVCDSDIFHLSHYLWSGPTLGIRVHFRGKKGVLDVETTARNPNGCYLRWGGEAELGWLLAMK